MLYASIAQAAERILGKDEVSSSNLLRSSIFFPLKLCKINAVTVKISVNFFEEFSIGKLFKQFAYFYLRNT